jgi:hypothetical protein
VAKIELPEDWAGIAEPLRARMADIERGAPATRNTDRIPRSGPTAAAQQKRKV